MVKCPACGYQYGHTYNHSNEIARLKSLRSKKSREYIKKLTAEISINVPSEFSQKALFLFLKGIENVDNRTVERAIEHYLKAGYHLQGKGFFYIRAMIQNESVNKKKKLSNEYKRLGRTPKIRRLKDEQ